MARTLSPAVRITIALVAIAGLTFIAQRASAERPLQRAAISTAPKASITIKPVAPVPKRTSATTLKTTAQGPRSTRPTATTYRNPFSADATSSSGDSRLLPGPRSRWRKAPLPPNNREPVQSALQTIAPVIATPARPITPALSSNEPKPGQSTLQLIVPKPAESAPKAFNPVPAIPATKPEPTRVTGVETPSITPSVLEPPTQPAITTSRTAMSVKTAILTADPQEPAEFDWSTPPALKSLPNNVDNDVASRNPVNDRRNNEPSVLELPDPTQFAPQPKEPIWLEAAAQKQRSPIDQATFEDPPQSEPPPNQPSASLPFSAPANSEPPGDEVAGESTDSSADEEPLIISDYSDSPEGWLAQAKEAVHSAKSIEELSAALELCQRVVVASPTDELSAPARRLAAWAHNRRGEMFIDAGRTVDALTEFQEALANDPKNSLAIHNRAVTLAQQNEFDAALIDFNRVIELNPGLAIAYHNRAELLAAQGKMDEAVADYTQALEIVADDPELYRGRAHALQQLGQFEQALTDLDNSIHLAPEDAQGYTQRGNLLADCGEYERALEDLEQSLAIEPTMAETHRALAWVKATCPQERYRDAYQALGAAKKAIALSPQDDYLALDALAAAHANAGEFDKAIETQRQAIDNAPVDAAAPMQSRLHIYKQRQPYRMGR
jgi:tetratricopeptide (TPR) repeat protein